MRKDTWKLVAIGLGLLMILAYFGYISIPGLFPAPGQVVPPGEQPPTELVPAEEIRAAKAQWQIRGKLTKTAAAAGDTAYVGIVRADESGYFDLLNPMEETEYDAVPDTSAITYSSGDELLMAVSSDDDAKTGAYEAYPRWFYIEHLDHGATIKALPLANPKGALQESMVGTNYRYKVNGAACESVGTVAWLEGTTNYWDFGYFELYERVAKDYLIQQITNKGTVGCTLNDGASWEDTDAEINANFTFTSDSEDIYFELIGEATDVAWGIPTLAVTSKGQVKQYNAVLIWTTDATGISTQELYDDGWKQIDKVDLTADVAFYYVLNPLTDGCIPGTGEVLDIRVPLTISDSGLSASTEYEFEGWVLDWQNLNDVARGTTTTSLPSNNGFISDPGCDSIVEPRALTVSSGSAATMQLLGHFTTNA